MLKGDQLEVKFHADAPLDIEKLRSLAQTESATRCG